MTTRLIQLLEQAEGNKQFAYQDSKGYWTIGIGRCVDHRKGIGLRTYERYFLLQNDIDEITEQLSDQLPLFEQLSEVRRSVLTSIAFNCGVTGLLKFKRMLKSLEELDYKQAATELLDSDAARNAEHRYHILATMLITDKYPSFIK